jgi:hypothetical protein
MYTKYLHHIHPPMFFHPLPPSMVPTPTQTYTHIPRQDLFHSPGLRFCKRKKMTFLLVYISKNQFISFIFLLSVLVPFLWCFQHIWKFCVHSYIENMSTTFTFLTSFFYPPSLICDLPLTWPVFHNIAVFVLGLYSTYKRKDVTVGLLSLANFT